MSRERWSFYARTGDRPIVYFRAKPVGQLRVFPVRIIYTRGIYRRS